MPRQDLEHITLADFSPGIHGDWYGGNEAVAAPDGSAQIDDTWGCVASAAGALIPAPRKTATQTQTLLDSEGIGNTKYPAGEHRNYILVMRTASPVYNTNDLDNQSLPAFPDLVGVTYGYWIDPASASSYKPRILARLYKVFSSGTFDVATNDGLDILVTYLLPRAAIDLTRTHKANPNIPGEPQFIFGTATYDASDYRVTAYPDNDTPNLDGTEATALDGLGDRSVFIVCHQGRIIGFRGELTGQGFGTTATIDPTEAIGYTAVNNYSVADSGADGVIFVEENPSGYGSWVSMNASELLLIKRRGGGVVVRGDLTNPTVVRLPGLASTGNAINVGIVTPSGYVYGTNRGIYRWNGGDVSEYMTPQISGWFWETPTSSKRFGLQGSFAWQEPYIYCPNNFCIDTRSGGIFRYAEPETIRYIFHDTSDNGNIIAAREYIDASNTEVLAWFDPSAGTDEYSWRSQPLARTINRLLRFTEINIVLQGVGNVTITLTGINGSTVTKTFAVDSTRPVAASVSIGLDVMDAEVLIVSTGTGGTPVAPIVYRLDFGTHPSHGVNTA